MKRGLAAATHQVDNETSEKGRPRKPNPLDFLRSANIVDLVEQECQEKILRFEVGHRSLRRRKNRPFVLLVQFLLQSKSSSEQCGQRCARVHENRAREKVSVRQPS